ncbi:hypothetical protein ACROYT_G032760 [Oculina patagonica]
MECWRRRRRRRSPPPCIPRDCQVISWSTWSPCTHKCGTSGTQTRTRAVTQAASCGGSCSFVLSETSPCNIGKCQNSGTPVSSGCSCPPGYQGTCCEIVTVTSTLTPEPRASPSAGNATTPPMTSQAPQYQSSPTPCSEHHCQVSSWSTWSPCTHQCGTSGTQTRTRTKTVVEGCGGICPLDLSQTRFCNTDKCQNSGTPTRSGCLCPPGYQGTCCEMASVVSSLAPTPSSLAVFVTPTPAIPVTTPPPFIVFEIEPVFDFVELADSLGLRIEILDGSRSGFNITVGGDRTQLLRIRFFSDSIVVAQGFLAQYNITFVTAASSLAPTPSSSSVAVTPTPTLPMTTPPPFIIGCGGMLNGSSGSFASPGYPVSYTVNLDCLWTLRIPANGSLRLQFIVFETEAGFDFVELTDSSGQRIARLNGSRSGFTVTVRGDRTQLLNIRFFSDFIIVRQGFLAQYNITVASALSSLAPTPTSSAVIVTPTPAIPVTAPPPFIGFSNSYQHSLR